MANFFPTNVQKLFCVVLVILLATELVNSDKTVSFSISDFRTIKSSLILQEYANISASGDLQLIDANVATNEVGRALYTTPIPLWDHSTGNVASFVTTFSFTLEDIGSHTPADGFVFVLVPSDGWYPGNSAGGNLGVVDASNAYNNFVGVEFDNYINEWDPTYPHIGIDVNSIKSLKTKPWKRVNLALVKVSIAYDSDSKILSVVLSDDLGQLSTVAQVVDFKDVLPETVRIGFSAATSALMRQVHNIHSWDFSSILKTTTSSTNNISSYVA
ncbi:lectin [Trifolium medium]|uniref:Lectin n=1 Tax=Trifolium medium TaxID=97028 RepID=A0A392LY74_9FABA|nr:lectin [Trifolium medium]